MKKRTWQFIVAYVMLNLHGFAQTASWHQTPAPPALSRYDDIFFLNEDLGWAADFGGAILRTENGGESWQYFTVPNKHDYRSIMFFDSSKGFMGRLNGDSIYFYVTDDGAVTWQPVQNFPGPHHAGICGMCRLNDSIAFAVGPYYGPPSFFKTVDKGNSWSYVDLSPYMSGVVDVYFWSKDSGIVVGAYGQLVPADSGGIILSTWNGGDSWQVRHKIDLPKSLCWKITFPSSKVGYVSLEQLNYQDSIFYFFKTTDGGIDWQEKIYHQGDYYNAEGIGFINDSLGWIGGNGNAFITKDGGNIWEIDSSFDKVFNRFRKVSDTISFCSGGYINRYSMKGFITSVFSNDFSNHRLDLIPNPAIRETKVRLRLFKTASLELNIYSMSGVNVFHQSSHQFYIGDNYLKLQLSALIAGEYTVVFSNDESTITQKLIVQ